MIKRRYISKDIIESKEFLALSVEDRLLYFYIYMNANKDGTCRNAFATAYKFKFEPFGVKRLFNSGFLSDTESKILCVTHHEKHAGAETLFDQRMSTAYRRWRESVRNRDNYTCRHCGSITNLVAHHIVSFTNNPELRLDVNNGITLCSECHKKEHRRIIENG